MGGSGDGFYWSFCVDYLETALETGASAHPAVESRGKVDYREVLNPEQFAVYLKLRTLRQAISKEEGVPVYVIFTNEHLAAMVQRGPASRGGSWNDGPRLCRPAYRIRYAPENRSYDLGFRVASVQE
jgi:hypothetical protein